MLQQKQPAASEQITQLTNQLSSFLAQRADLQDQLTTNEKQVTALRNALQGVKLGESFAEEKAAAKAESEASADTDPME